MRNLLLRVESIYNIAMRFHYKTQVYSIKINKGFLSLCLFFFSLCCLLGGWQLHRFHHKKMLVRSYEGRLKELPKPLEFLSEKMDEIQFQPITAEGDYINELSMFIQNRMHENKQGFEVLTPLRIRNNDKLLLVNRGWVEKPKGQTLPTLLSLKGIQHIVGYIKRVDEYQFILGKNILEPVTYPLVMQKIDMNEISRLTGQPFYPFIVRLDPAVQNGFVRDWVISVIPPERHRMYAVQWFSFAFILLLAYFGFCIERVRESDNAKS